jgi:flagellar biosynthesis/type III secretory pathway protein FliH
VGRIVGGAGRVVPKAVLDARAEAAALAAAARADADALRAQAGAALDEARRQGRDEGRAEAAAEMAALLADARAQAERLREAATPTAIALAVKMAEKVVGRAVTLAPELMAEIAGAALEACRPGGDWIRLRVHPDDAAAVNARRDTLAARAPGVASLDVVSDETVGRHGCVVETAVGRVDARLDTQLAALERALLQETHG